MANGSPVDLTPPSTSLQIMVVDLDPVVRSGLVASLNRFPDLQVVVEAETVSQTLQIVAEQSISSPDRAIAVVVSGLPLSPDNSDTSGLALAQRLRSTQARVPLFLWVEPEDTGLARAFELGVAGCCLRGSSLLDLVTGVRHVGAGRAHWSPDLVRRISALPLPAGRSLRWVDRWRDRMKQSGLAYIQETLNTLELELQNPTRPWIEQELLAGRRRELYAARWVVNQLLSVQEPPPTSSNPPANSGLTAEVTRTPTTALVGAPLSNSSEIAAKTLQSDIFDRVASHLQSNLENLTPAPLEIDILRQDKKRELFFLVLRQVEGVVEELRFSQVTAEQLADKRAPLLQDLWESVTKDFFGRYYTLLASDQAVDVVSQLLQTANTVKTEILSRIPLVPELCSYLLFQAPLEIDNASYAAGTPTARNRATVLLENLIIQVANAVMQPLLNQFADAEPLKQSFYDRRLLSSREIERFRNDLSWRYRVDQYVNEPKAVFESQYRLLVFTPFGIQPMQIYAPRHQELTDLKGIPFWVTLAIETRDALAPRIQSIASFMGRGIVYLLTEIIGRGIGLVGRGILKGVGNIWQENRSNR